MEKKVSIVIPCRNEENFISNCVDSIITQSYGFENIEVFIADGLSNDGTRRILEKYTNQYSNIYMLDNEERTAPAGMNLGIKRASGDIIIIFGAHSYMDKEYVKYCVKNLEDVNVDCVGGRIISISENDNAEAISFAMSSPFGVGNALFRYSDKEQLVDTVAFGAYKKEIFDKIGLFDMELVRNQDDEFNFRLLNSGGRILLSPDITSYYYTRGSFGKLWRQYYQYGFWKVRVIQKHKRPASIRQLIPALFVLGLVGGAILSMLFNILRQLYFTAILLYLIIALFAAFKASKNKFKYIFKIVYCFLILHLSYGIGFIEGIYSFYINRNKNKTFKNTKMSR